MCVGREERGKEWGKEGKSGGGGEEGRRGRVREQGKSGRSGKEWGKWGEMDEGNEQLLKKLKTLLKNGACMLLLAGQEKSISLVNSAWIKKRLLFLTEFLVTLLPFCENQN